MTTKSRSTQRVNHSNTPCPKCSASRTHSAGTRIRKLEQTQVQMRRCPTCNCQFTDHRFAPQPVDSKKSLPKSVGQSRAVPPHPPMPSAAKSGNKTRVSAGSRTRDFSDSVATVSAHQRLELDLPSDWSATGLQGFTVFAQHELHRASQSFTQPLHAELAWQRIDPELRDYIRARQRFELALSLQWNAMFQTLHSSSHAPLTPFTNADVDVITPLKPALQPVFREENRSRNAVKPARVNPRRSAKLGSQAVGTPLASAAHATVAPDAMAGTMAAREAVVPIQPAIGGDPLEEPDPAQSLEATLEPLLRAERSRWQREKLELTQRLFHVESEKEVLFGKWTKVKGYLERQKTESNIPLGIARAESSNDNGLKRVSSLAVSPSQAANIERLSSALMAHLVRLEGYRIKVKNIPHLTGETGPWRAVITHLLERGAVQREGNGLFIALSLVERLRRNLPPPKLDTATATRDQARRVGMK